jgi:TRAP-type C4-dicarboxylate transport system substrate-binding protein
MNPMRALRTAALAAAAMLPWLAGPGQAQEWRGWNIHAADYPNGRGMDRFGELVAQRTNNRIRMRTYHSAQLGQQDEAIQQMRLGSIDFANFNLSPFNNLAPSTQVVTLPFLFRDVAHMQRAIDGVAGEEIARDLEQIGIIALAWYDAGAAQHLHDAPGPHAGRPPRHEDPRADLRPLDRSDAALGATRPRCPSARCFTCLQSGVIDGAENNWPSYRAPATSRVALSTRRPSIPTCREVLAGLRQRWQRLNEPSATSSSVARAKRDLPRQSGRSASRSPASA